MKRFWLILLSLGLVMAFSVSAFAVDVKVSAEYYAGGLYLNKVTVDDGFENWQGDRGSEQPSTAFFFQRLRMGADFIVSPCLKLVTRFDAMERIWGGARSSGYGGSVGFDDDDDSEPLVNSAGTRAENENIAVDLVYIDYTAPIGQFKVGYQKDYVWGTVFADRGEGNPAGQIQYWKSFGPATVFAGYAKEVDNSYSAVTSTSLTDKDVDSYRLGGIYNFKNNKVSGEAGALFRWNRDASPRDFFFMSYMSNIYVIDPYVKAKIGPVNIQAELQYYFGDMMKFEPYTWLPFPVMPPMANVSVSALSVFVDATANFGMFNVGGTFAYLSGDDPGTTDKLEGSGRPFAINTGGLDWNPCLILFNTDLNYWAGNIYGHGHSLNPFLTNATVVNSEMSNALFFQGRVGVKPTPQWDIQMAVSFAQADKKPAYYYDSMMGFWGDYATQPGGTYGTEIDITSTYKITNNLTYMLGIGYLFTGDYFKGRDYDFGAGGSKVNDDFIFINKLILSF